MIRKTDDELQIVELLSKLVFSQLNQAASRYHWLRTLPALITVLRNQEESWWPTVGQGRNTWSLRTSYGLSALSPRPLELI